MLQNVEDDMDGIERRLGQLDDSGNRLIQEKIPGSEEVIFAVCLYVRCLLSLFDPFSLLWFRGPVSLVC